MLLIGGIVIEFFSSLGGSRVDIDPRDVRRVCEELGLDRSELPGPKSRVWHEPFLIGIAGGHDK